MSGTETGPEGARRRAAASLAIFSAYLSDFGTSGILADGIPFEHLRRLRHEIRMDEGGGGMCHAVTEACLDERGWMRVAVAYLSGEGDVICSSHYVSVLADGTIVDPTADQFGEGHDVRVLPPGDPEYGRYRPEFHQDYNPDVEPEALAAWLPDWDGRWDTQVQGDLVTQRGDGWWLVNTGDLVSYLEQQKIFADEKGDRYGTFVRGRLDALNEESSGPRP